MPRNFPRQLGLRRERNFLQHSYKLQISEMPGNCARGLRTRHRTGNCRAVYFRRLCPRLKVVKRRRSCCWYIYIPQQSSWQLFPLFAVQFSGNLCRHQPRVNESGTSENKKWAVNFSRSVTACSSPSAPPSLNRNAPRSQVGL